MFAGVFGLIMGSFANVVIYRVPRSISVVTPGSACPRCSHMLAWWENVPVLSFLLLGAKCRRCKGDISVRYPLIEGLMGASWGAAAWFVRPLALVPAVLVWIFVLVAVSAIDLEHRRIPNKVLFPGSAVVGLLLIAAAVADRHPRLLLSGAEGAVLYAAPLLLLALIVPGGMGLGDVKLAGFIGMVLGSIGLPAVGVGAFTGFLIGSVVGVLLILTGAKTRKDTIPFGPSMAAGALTALFFARSILSLWLG